MKYKITFLKNFLHYKVGEIFQVDSTIIVLNGKNGGKIINNIFDLMRKGILKIEINDSQIKPNN